MIKYIYLKINYDLMAPWLRRNKRSIVRRNTYILIDVSSLPQTSNSCVRPSGRFSAGQALWRRTAACLRRRWSPARQVAGRHHALSATRRPQRHRHRPGPTRTGSQWSPTLGLRRSCGTRPVNARSCKRVANRSSLPADPVHTIPLTSTTFLN